MTPSSPLPAAGPALLLRALFKRGKPAGSASAVFESAFAADRIDPAQLARYNALFGFAGDALPLTFHYLIVQRAHLATMLDAAFPFRLLGMVHTENALHEQRRPDLDAPLTILTRVEIEAPTEHGARYCTLHSSATQNGLPVCHCTSRYLAQRGRPLRKHAAQPGEPETMASFGAWTLDADAGRRYAAVSGDWNPIHLWRWSAKLFGLSSPIIHGMHTMAAACAQIEKTLGEKTQRPHVTTMSARFKAPIALGSRVALLADAEAGSYRVRIGEMRAVEGKFELAQPTP